MLLILASASVCGSPAVTVHTFIIDLQGQLEHAGIPFQGTGYFKFAIIDDSIVPRHNIWTNDGSKPAPGREPDNAVPMTIKAGRFSVSLGDTQQSDLVTPHIVSPKHPEALLRVWFSTDGDKFVQLSPDHPLSNQSQTFDAKSADTLNGISMTSMANIIDNSKKTTEVINAALFTSN